MSQNSDSFLAALFLFLLTYSKIKAFNWLKKNRYFGICKPANNVCCSYHETIIFIFNQI